MQATSPSSSTTTPSPSLPFLQHPEAPDTLQLADLDPQEREERQRAVQKLLARAEYSKLTRGLRARLAYASYKASNNLSHVPLPVLEDRIHDPSPSLAPSPSPAPAPPSSPYSATHKRRAAMAPPASPSRSLYSSLLGPPPSKRPRHVYGPVSASASGPTPADLLPSYSPATPRKAPPSPRRTPHPHSPFVNGGQGRTVRTVLQGRARSTVTEKEDMNAAATLTALMFNRPSPSQRNEDGGPRTSTPAPLPDHKPTEDADAAELMLYLATSPSPARPTVVRRAPGSMGRVLFAGAGAAKNTEKGSMTDGDSTPALTASQSSLPSSQETTLTSQLLPPPPSPSLSLARSPPLDAPNAKKSTTFDVSRRLFVDSDDSHRIAELRDGGGARFGLGKGIDLVEAK